MTERLNALSAAIPAAENMDGAPRRAVMAFRRVATRAVALAALLTLSSWTVAATAGAHVHVSADHAVRGDYALVTFQVPRTSMSAPITRCVAITRW
ncbi:hypothetical protein [Mycolicibacterium gadium]|uniref:hypothetical protein n=1 Tax=Mycolicibacterium gadium TaxID=1794 RepID=UPI0035586FDE